MQKVLIRTPGPVPFETCICSNAETIFSRACHVFGLWVSKIPRNLYFASAGKQTRKSTKGRSKCKVRKNRTVFGKDWPQQNRKHASYQMERDYVSRRVNIPCRHVTLVPNILWILLVIRRSKTTSQLISWKFSSRGIHIDHKWQIWMRSKEVWLNEIKNHSQSDYVIISLSIAYRCKKYPKFKLFVFYEELYKIISDWSNSLEFAVDGEQQIFQM